MGKERQKLESYLAERHYLERQQDRLLGKQRIFLERLEQLTAECQRIKRIMAVENHDETMDDSFRRAYEQGQYVVNKAKKILANEMAENRINYQRDYTERKEKLEDEWS